MDHGSKQASCPATLQLRPISKERTLLTSRTPASQTLHDHRHQGRGLLAAQIAQRSRPRNNPKLQTRSIHITAPTPQHKGVARRRNRVQRASTSRRRSRYITMITRETDAEKAEWHVLIVEGNRGRKTFAPCNSHLPGGHALLDHLRARRLRCNVTARSPKRTLPQAFPSSCCGGYQGSLANAGKRSSCPVHVNSHAFPCSGPRVLQNCSCKDDPVLATEEQRVVHIKCATLFFHTSPSDRSPTPLDHFRARWQMWVCCM